MNVIVDAPEDLGYQTGFQQSIWLLDQLKKPEVLADMWHEDEDEPEWCVLHKYDPFPSNEDDDQCEDDGEEVGGQP